MAFALGAAAGAVLGILFAPDKGAATRTKITEKGKKATGEVKEMVNKGRQKFNNLKEEVSQLINEFVEEDEMV